MSKGLVLLLARRAGGREPGIKGGGTIQKERGGGRGQEMAFLRSRGLGEFGKKVVTLCNIFLWR